MIKWYIYVTPEYGPWRKETRNKANEGREMRIERKDEQNFEGILIINKDLLLPTYANLTQDLYCKLSLISPSPGGYQCKI